MGIRWFTASKDTTITNAYRSSLKSRATGSNMGASDVLESFCLYGQVYGADNELSRILVDFPISEISNNISAGKIPSTARFYFKLTNVEHSENLPIQFTMKVRPISRNWEEGVGLDMEEYLDLGKSNWLSASTSTAWTTAGGDFLSTFNQTAYFDKGTEDLELDVTDWVNDRIAGNVGTSGYGLGIMMNSPEESALSSSYTKMFSARTSEYFFSRPRLEARWDSSVKDDRPLCYISSSMASASDNLNTIYLYNVQRGQLANLPGVGTGAIYIQLKNVSGSNVATQPNTPITGGWVSTGMYTATFAYSGSGRVYDVWYNGSTVFHTGTILMKEPGRYGYSKDDSFAITTVEGKRSYTNKEQARFRFFINKKNNLQNVYSVVNTTNEHFPIKDTFYSITRLADNLTVVPYGTGSTNHTKLSYNTSGSYFDFDMSMLEAGYSYDIRLMSYLFSDYIEHSFAHKFRVEE